MAAIRLEMTVRGLTLARSLTLALAGVALVVALLLGILLRRWGDSLLAASGTLREAASRRAESLAVGTLDGARAAVRSLERQARSGSLEMDDPLAVERALFAQILANDDLAEATFTWTGDSSSAIGGTRTRSPWQVSVFREGRGPYRIVTRYTHAHGRGFVVDERKRPWGSIGLDDSSIARAAERAKDPTGHLTFASTIAHHRFSTEPLWTDLHYAETDGHLPENERLVLVTVMQVLEEGSGRALGVARVGLLAARLDEITLLRVDEGHAHDPHQVFLADQQGRLITRLSPEQPLEDQDGDLRPAAGILPAEMRAALDQPALREVSVGQPRSGRFQVGGRTYLLSARSIAGSQEWRIGVLVPEDHYLHELRSARRMLVGFSLAVFAVIVALGAASLRSVRRSLALMVGSTARMRDFDFAPATAHSPFADLSAVMQDLEQAKTALRAMGKYLPVDLVRQLYRSRQEPQLGGELRDVTLMFTDIEGFTALSERLAPDVLAAALGRYFEAMTAAIHASGGIVDKYIGDAVMALWNAPSALADHVSRACGAALACVQAHQMLMRTPEWEGLPPFRTRFGLHREEVLVGHFGAPDRISYTAIGDGVNLAARLEGLNKVYGTTILVSQNVRQAASENFGFRLIDVVAVKGKSRAVRVYELLGATAHAADNGHVRNYEAAFAAYQERRFADAFEQLQAQQGDPPSRVLLERCRRFLASPPSPDWDGTYATQEK